MTQLCLPSPGLRSSVNLKGTINSSLIPTSIHSVVAYDFVYSGFISLYFQQEIWHVLRSFQLLQRSYDQFEYFFLDIIRCWTSFHWVFVFRFRYVYPPPALTIRDFFCSQADLYSTFLVHSTSTSHPFLYSLIVSSVCHGIYTIACFSFIGPFFGQPPEVKQKHLENILFFFLVSLMLYY